MASELMDEMTRMESLENAAFNANGVEQTLLSEITRRKDRMTDLELEVKAFQT